MKRVRRICPIQLAIARRDDYELSVVVPAGMLGARVVVFEILEDWDCRRNSNWSNALSVSDRS
jgi:hypothetical protein